MEYILNQKDIQYEDAALKVIAKAAEGGMRDALSILDQVISFGENNVTLENALLVTGSVTKTDLLNYLQAVVDQKTPEALEMIHKLVQDGRMLPELWKTWWNIAGIYYFINNPQQCLRKRNLECWMKISKSLRKKLNRKLFIK